MADIIIAVAGKVAEYLVAPIGRQVGYVFNYRSYLDDLKKQVEQLDDARGRRQRDVDEANRQGEEIEQDVDEWLINTAATTEKTKNFIEGEEAAKKSCFNVKWRYLRSREAKKQTRVIAELIQKNNNFTRVAYHLPPQRIWSTCLRGIETFEARAETLNQIMEALKTDDIKSIGVWGMGGVGKTTIANQVMKLAEEFNLFDKVVKASNISQISDVSKIQGDIASILGLKFEENEPELGRADRLRKSLNNHKRVLVILDDIWEVLSLEEKIGIPCGRDGCKVLLTSRNRDLLSNWMCTQKNFEVKHLSEEEALSLFKKYIASDVDEDPELPPEAREVAKKCDGLPVAIVTIAKALKGKSVAVWRNALEELNRAEPTNIPGVSENVYSCLQLSYNYLKGDEVKRLFLLCGMLGSGDISMDQLLQYVLGLDLFQHNLSLQQATDKLVTLVQILKDSSLLLETEDKYPFLLKDRLYFEPDDIRFIRMHDVVRDVARAIASKDPRQFVLKEALGFEEPQRRDDELINCTHISLNDSNIQRLPERLVCPKQEFFFLVHPRSKIPDTFFEEMKQLKVLHLHRMNLRVLPSSLNALSNLQTLCLTRCSLGDVAIIGVLKKLRVLSFVDSNIERLPEEMMQLNDLRVLDLLMCRGLRVIPRNVISSLSRLEYLCVGGSFTEWGTKRFDNDGETNACLSELTNLSSLKTLVLNTGDLNSLPKEMVFDNLLRYDIAMGDVWLYTYTDDKRYSRVLKLEGIQSLHDLVTCFPKLLKTTQALELRKLDDGGHSFCHEFVREGFPELKHLSIQESGGIQYVFNSMEWAPSRCAFPILESLDLRGLSNLDPVWYGPIPKGAFCHLRELRLRDCRRLKYAMLLSQTQEREFVFPHLIYMDLEMLPEFISFCSTETSLIKESSTTSDAQTPFFNQQVALPSLESLRMYELDMVGTVWQDQLHAGSFRKLKSLDIESCPTLRNVYLLSSLETLEIAYCDSLDEILDVECNEEIRDIAAAPLRKLSLKNLPRLKSIWKKDPHRERAAFRNLRVLKVWDCPLGTHLFPATVAKGLENLETLHVDGCEVEEIVAYKNGDVAAPSLFPKLTSLKLNRLGKLRCFYGGTTSHTLQWPLLKDLGVCYCRKVEVLFHGLGSDAEADINGIIIAQPPLFFVQKDTFPNLEKLTFTATMKIWQGQFSNESLGKLEHLEVTECNDISAMTSFSIISILRNVKHLKLTICNSRKEVFQVEEQQGFSHILGSAWIRENLSSLVVSDCENLMYLLAPSMAKKPVKLEEHTTETCSKGKDMVSTEAIAATDDELVFAKLETVELRNLPNLKSFGSTRSPLKFPSLKEMTVQKCGAMESFCGTFSESTRLQIDGLPHLTQLCMQISGLFQNLQNIHTLKVWNCENLRYLVTPSVAKNLVQLIQLNISRCCMMTEVVGPEGDDDATSDIEFPKLRRLTLDALSKLKWFCSARNYTFRFPSLENLEIYDCNEMEFFCEGVLITPRPVTFNRSDLEGDLNTAIKKKIALEKDSKGEDSTEEDSKEDD